MDQPKALIDRMDMETEQFDLETENTQAYVAITQRIANRLEGSYKYD
ncbi:hypothetical protein HaLaN_18237, partial [Haematococcus lacustris]